MTPSEKRASRKCWKLFCLGPFGMRILQFDMLAAENAARVAAETEGRGMNLKTADVREIAAIALARDMVCGKS